MPFEIQVSHDLAPQSNNNVFVNDYKLIYVISNPMNIYLCYIMVACSDIFRDYPEE
jgi:hypothetical protein